MVHSQEKPEIQFTEMISIGYLDSKWLLFVVCLFVYTARVYAGSQAGWAEIFHGGAPQLGNRTGPETLGREILSGVESVSLPTIFLEPSLYRLVSLQDSVQEEMEEKWANKKMELEQDEKLEREKILLQQSKCREV